MDNKGGYTKEEQEVRDGLEVFSAVLDSKESEEAVDLIVNNIDRLEALESFVKSKLAEGGVANGK